MEGAKEAQTKHRCSQGRCTGPHRRQSNQADKPGRGCGLERQIKFEGRCRTLARPSVPAKASEDNTHTRLFVLGRNCILLSPFFVANLDSWS